MRFKKLTTAIRQFPERLWKTFTRFSDTVALLIVFYLLLDLAAYTTMDADTRVYWILGLGAIALLAADLLFEARPINWYWGRGIKLGLLVLLMLTYPSLERYELRPLLLLAATLSFFGIAVCVLYRHRTEACLGNLLIRAGTALLFALVLFAGVSLILLVADLLLFSVSSDAYGEVTRFCFILFAPLMFLSGIPKAGEEKPLLRGYQQLLKVVVLPLLGVFLIVLYCYYIKLIVNTQLPISQLGGVSLVFLCINLPMVMLAKPFADGKLRKLLLYGTLPVFVALFFTAGRQVALFGVSVTRYIVLVGGLALLVCVLLMIFCKEKYRYGVFPVLLVTALLAAYGPQSCYSLTRFSQHGRLTAALTQAQMLDGGVVVPNPDAPVTLKREILELVDYCDREDLELPDSFPVPYNYDHLKDVLGFDHGDLPETTDPEVWHHYPTGEPIDLGEGSYLFPRGSVYEFEAPCGALKVDTTDRLIVICNGQVLCSLSQDELRQAVVKAVMKEDVAASYVFTLETEELDVKIPFSYISEPNPEPYGDWGYTYIKVK